ncbi:pyridoxamine 5'-phosphate oxidase family protein [Alphaproteobacteria bacterium GH1-50]|uniref:Pyridoxamine 5'-phosphate oxidase family protein n=1 Tax=Kangsaoukella pontilimi TaxID=2691042 RepID=A0A7C9MCT3_9RHOB|nr:pyridoxamine 5'-phosphate oxidase family protein [Kangsaoukella pontilimi]MXQ07791.1 pyridoxamine 5'-phosphate oxidase family protein [Kangsaoukella pontilimi]
MTEDVTHNTFYNSLDDIVAGMLSVDQTRPVPMSHYVDRDENALWFITAKGTDLEAALRGGPQSGRHVVASKSGELYATIDGLATLVIDPAKLDEIWSVVSAAWFEDGQKDDDIALIRFDLSEAEVWQTAGNLKFLFEIAKANVTGEKPETGSHGRLSFAA